MEETMSLSLCAVIAEGLKQKTSAVPNKSGLPKQCILQCTDRLSAQVALLQSPILSVANTPYFNTQNYRGLPVDKPHTRGSAVQAGVHSCEHVPYSLRKLHP